MRLDRLILDNFLTYKHLDYKFESKPLQIQGLNLTDEKQKSNGSGKSGLQTGIEFCITASNSRDVRDIELVSYGHKEARTQLFASCDVRRETIHIDWTIKAKGSNKLTLSKRPYDGEWSEVEFSNVNDGKGWILSWFSITKEDLFNYYIINKTRFKSFFKSSSREKVDLINRFSDASIIEGIEKIDNTEIESQYQTLLKDINSIDGKIELLQEQLEAAALVDFKAELLEKKSDIEEEIGDIEDSITDTEEAIEAIKLKRVELVSREKEIELEKIQYEEEKSPINERLDIENATISSITEDLLEANRLVSDFDSTDWDKERLTFEESISAKKREEREVELKKRDQEAKEAKVLKFLKEIELKLNGAITCPHCLKEFTLEGDISTLKTNKSQGELLLDKITELKKTSEESIESIKTSVRETENSISLINKREQAENSSKNLLSIAANKIVSKLNEVKSQIQKHESELKQLDAEIEDCDGEIKDLHLKDREFSQRIVSLKEKIENYRTEIKNYRTQLENLTLDNNKEKIKSLKAEIVSFEKIKIQKESESSAVGDKIYERNQWATNFKQFRMYLANQSLEAIEFHCNRYLSEMGSDLKVKMDGFKVLADGTIKDEITAKVVRDVERSFSSFSGGEQGRLLFASILANRHMINSTHPYGGLDFLSVDEVFEGVDSIGLKHLIESAKQLQIAVMIITHVSDEETSEDILTIVKKNGISTIREHE